MVIRGSAAACLVWIRNAFAACVLALSAPAAFAATISPSAPSVTAGDPFSASLLDDVNVNEGIAAITMLVDFDATKLSLVDVTLGSLLPDWILIYGVTAGEATISAEESFTDLGGSGSIFRFDFVALAGASGPTTVTVTADDGVPGEYQLAPLSFVATIKPRAVGPSVPAPGLACLAIPAFAFAVARRRRQAT